MQISRIALSCLGLSLGVLAAACSSESAPDGSGGSSGTGGAIGTGGGNGVGGTTGGTGATTGAGGGTGGDGTGGGSGGGSGGDGTGGSGASAAFTCPSGLTGMEPNLASVTVMDVATAPDMDGIEGGTQTFLEGPVWANGALYVSQIRVYGDQPPARVLKLDGTSLTSFIADSGTNGLAIDGDGALVAASHKLRGITYFDLASPATAPTGTVDMGPFNSPNDLTVRADGNVYFTDPEYQCGGCNVDTNAYRISPSGEVTPLDPPHGNPNGIALSPDGNTLYIAGDNAGIQKYPVAADGSVGAGTQFVATTGVDGMTVDCAGNVYATVHSQAKVDVYTPDGTLIDDIAAGGNTTNVAFGGPDMTTLYITRYDKVLRSVELDIPGLPY